MQEIRLLRADEIEVKIKQVTNKGALALLYKTARTDMAVLDEVFGAGNWTNDYKEIKGNLYCGIAVYMTDTSNWVWRWDCGIESREDDGNEKKGEASDAFKRAGTRWGIGRELYTAPFIFLRVPTVEDGKDGRGRARYSLQDKFARFSVRGIEYDATRRISFLEIVDRNGEIVFRYPQQPAKSGTGTTKAQPAGDKPHREQKPAQSPAEPPKITYEKACDMTFEKGGRKYRLGELSEEWLNKALKNDAYTPLHPYIQVILKQKIMDAAANALNDEDDEDLPFDV